MHLRYKLVEFEECIAFQILEQSEAFTNFIRIDDGILCDLTESSGFKVIINSRARPQLKLEENNSEYGDGKHLIVYLRGYNSDKDKSVELLKVPDKYSASDFYDMIHMSMSEAIEAFENYKQEKEKDGF